MNLEEVMPAIEGVVNSLSGDRPSGYPFSRIRVYCLEGADILAACASGFDLVCEELEFSAADKAENMAGLDFKKAGKEKPDSVKEWVQLIKEGKSSQVPNEYLTTKTLFPQTKEPNKATTSCRKYLVEVERNDCPEYWEAIKFKKQIKKYITEDLGINITPALFGGDEKEPFATRVIVEVSDMKESLYQALEKFGEFAFADTPIRLVLPERHNIRVGAPHKIGDSAFWIITELRK